MKILDEKEELLSNIEASLQGVKRIVDIENKLYRIYRKPINLGFVGHFYLYFLYAISILGLSFYLSLNFSSFEYAFEKNEKTIAGIIFAYPLVIFLFNRYFMISKSIIYKSDIKELQKKRSELIASLAKTTKVPKDYWNINYFIAMKKYLVNKRADNLKEALNLLEEDIRHDETLSKLGAIQEGASRPRFFIMYTIE